jgi:succinylglutamate desuccinylase
VNGQLQLTGVFTTFTFVEKRIIEFAPCRPATRKMNLLIVAGRHGVNTPDELLAQSQEANVLFQ